MIIVLLGKCVDTHEHYFYLASMHEHCLLYLTSAHDHYFTWHKCRHAYRSQIICAMYSHARAGEHARNWVEIRVLSLE